MENIRHHHIRYKEGPAEGGPAEWAEELGKVRGVKGVSIDPSQRDVFVEYNLLECHEEAIEHWMVKVGFVLDEGLLQKIKRGWIHYTEENELDAIRAGGGHPCCDADELERKKKELDSKKKPD